MKRAGEAVERQIRSSFGVPAAILTILMAATMAAGAMSGPSQEVGPAWTGEAGRQFDFWMGEWEVNLRIQQEDASWKDSKSARTKIYRILDGKAILELWDEKADGVDAIRGSSLRYYDPAEGEWTLFLLWPGKNRAGTGALTGSFRHGRGEFFATRKGQDGTETLSRYTFSDITPNSLRWDDAFSKDGGKSWTNNWIMEFTRAEPRALWPAPGENAHTYRTGARCDLAEFREFEKAAGRFEGTIELHGDEGAVGKGSATLTGWKVLDGCAVMVFLDAAVGDTAYKSFSMLTWNTFASVFEETTLDNQTGTPGYILYGPKDEEGGVSLRTRRDVEPAVRHSWSFGDEGGISLRLEVADGEGWKLRGSAELNAAGSGM